MYVAVPYKTSILSVSQEYGGNNWKKTFHGQSYADIYTNLRAYSPIEVLFVDLFRAIGDLTDPLSLLK